MTQTFLDKLTSTIKPGESWQVSYMKYLGVPEEHIPVEEIEKLPIYYGSEEILKILKDAYFLNLNCHEIMEDLKKVEVYEDYIEYDDSKPFSDSRNVFRGIEAYLITLVLCKYHKIVLPTEEMYRYRHHKISLVKSIQCGKFNEFKELVREDSFNKHQIYEIIDAYSKGIDITSYIKKKISTHVENMANLTTILKTGYPFPNSLYDKAVKGCRGDVSNKLTALSMFYSITKKLEIESIDNDKIQDMIFELSQFPYNKFGYKVIRYMPLPSQLLEYIDVLENDMEINNKSNSQYRFNIIRNRVAMNIVKIYLDQETEYEDLLILCKNCIDKKVSLAIFDSIVNKSLSVKFYLKYAAIIAKHTREEDIFSSVATIITIIEAFKERPNITNDEILEKLSTDEINNLAGDMYRNDEAIQSIYRLSSMGYSIKSIVTLSQLDGEILNRNTRAGTLDESYYKLLLVQDIKNQYRYYDAF